MSRSLDRACNAGRSAITAALLACLILFICGCAADTGSTDEWCYFDDFSTDKAASDSHSHSAFLESPPDVAGPGFLMYVVGIPDKRSLGFHAGFWVTDLEATLEYEFPLECTDLMISSGTLEFDVDVLGDGSG
jgi:hypothetical protein